MSSEENNGYGREHSGFGLPCTTSADLRDTGGLISVAGIPHVSIDAKNPILGDSTTSSLRSFVVIKNLGEGSFGSVFLCDWHGNLPHEVPPPSAIHVNGAARGERIGMRLVAVKKLKRRWEDGWDECQRLKELKALRALTPHPCVVPLYDVFLSCETSELYFVFEAMEGNLYRFMKARKGRPLATGLLSCIFQQMAAGLHHMHSSGYFHRDMKPENVLVTTTGLFDYRSPFSQPQLEAIEKTDAAVICKIADFDSAREISSTPPYTEYVSARWYRAPEVLLKQRDYSTPVDMWALGAIMAELVNLKPIFPGSGEVDQINRIIKVLGDPADRGVDERGRHHGGGPWSHGLELARRLAFQFPQTEPRNMYTIFDKQTPHRLVECISDLLKFDPNLRLTSQQCLAHECLRECSPENLPCILPVQEIHSR
ncbi:kinase-like protein [Suillus paluster]|uniref:kinase-like protein n=1 Tax=Suillus paluster TaxID=48578 RepID=UPI001B87F90E|nr:kinase-like protein [Suillus paluster]KAG1736641.1 kinase-like protein [Suillus paluster]